ncbi:MAG: 16S rRNA (guanine(527)-N(7))-methyltransferase RsmG [Phycisphaerae bacterium]|nr:16S rRNA (guanine(527)-N(7))-methyltransferase RsmG [Phycisphaerae bacterium]
MSERFALALRAALAPWGLEPTVEQRAVLAAHFEGVLEANRTFNLTRATDPAEAAVALYADSLAVVAWAHHNGLHVRQVLDAGTGAGFPAVPVAVIQPQWQVTAADATGKKACFVEETAKRLGISNLTVAHTRVEDICPPPTYDLVLFKAVSQIDRCLKWCRRLVSGGGFAVLYKTPGLRQGEESAGRRAADRLGFAEAEPFAYALPCGVQSIERVLRVYVRR